jgi:hypothetical protein
MPAISFYFVRSPAFHPSQVVQQLILFPAYCTKVQVPANFRHEQGSILAVNLLVDKYINTIRAFITQDLLFFSQINLFGSTVFDGKMR